MASFCRGNNLEDYLNRLGGTKVQNELLEAGEGMSCYETENH